MYYFNWQTDDNGNKSLVEVDSSYADTADIVAYSSDNEGVDSNLNGEYINHSFIGLNASYSNEGGAIYNYDSSSIGDIYGDFVANYAYGVYTYGGAIYNFDSSIDYIEGNFIGNYAYAYSYAKGNTYILTTPATVEANGGAIYNEASDDNDSKLSFFALNGDMKFTGNYVETYVHGYYTATSSITSNAIYNYADSSSYDATINLNALDGYSLLINDDISGGSSHVSNQLIEINNVDITTVDYAAVDTYGLVAFN